MTAKICSICLTPIPAGAPGGFCPVCVLRGAEELVSTVPSGAPPLAEVRAAFPQLEVQSLIGQGGMGFVYKAHQPSLDRMVALKILAPALGGDPAFAERFAREARVLGKLNHPNIVSVYEHGVTRPAGPGAPSFYYLLMEYVDGVNLRQAMRAGRFSPEQALSVVPGICDALQAAHGQGIWHRDIKPENILLDARGRVKIADFGIARLVGDPQRHFTLTMTGAALGSAAYMAPEQHESPHDVDHRADIYSLGVVFYEMLTGELPLGRFKAPSQKSAVDARIDEIVLRTLAKERELRQQSAAELKTEVHHAAATRGGEKRSSHAQPAPVTKWSLGLMLGGIVMGTAAGVFTFGSTQGTLLTLSVVAFVIGFVANGIALSRMRSGLISTAWRTGLRVFLWMSPAAAVLLLVAWFRGETAVEEALRAREAAAEKISTAGGSARHTEGETAKPSASVSPESFRDWDAALLGAREQNGPVPWLKWPQQMKDGELLHRKGDAVGALRCFELAATGADEEFKNTTEAHKKKGGNPGYWPSMRHNWCLWQSRMNAGDMLCELGRLEEAAKSYTAAAATLDELVDQNRLYSNFPPDKVKDALATAFLKMGDVSAARKDEPAAKEYYRSAVAVVTGAERKDHKWVLDPGNREAGRDMSCPFDEEELVRLAAGIGPKPNDYGSDDWRALRELIGLACVHKSTRFQYLLEDKKLLSVQPLSLAALDWVLNHNSKALDFILKSLASQQVGADCDEPCVLAYVDEWERSAPAVDAHFTQTDGAGGINCGDFWAARQYYFPGNYLRYKYPRLEGAPLKAGSPGVQEKPETGRTGASERGAENGGNADTRAAQPGLTGIPSMEEHSLGDIVAFTAHCGPAAIFTVIGDKKTSTGQQLFSSGSRILPESNVYFDQLRVYFAVSEPNKASIAGRDYDLAKGRVFRVSESGATQLPLECPLKLTDKTLKELTEKLKGME